MAAALLLGVLGGCVSLGERESPIGPEALFETSALAPGPYSGLAWPQSDRLAFASSVEPGPPYPDLYTESRLFTVAPGGEEPAELSIERRTDCWNWHIRSPFALPDGRLGYLETCSGLPNEELWRLHSSFRAIDLSSHSVATLGEVHRTEVKAPNYPVTIAWDPIHGGRGLVAAASGTFCTNLYWLADRHIQYVEEMIDGFDPSDVFREGRRPQSGCARLPAWSPDGSSLALFADPDAVTNGVFETEHWELYVAAADLSGARHIDGPWTGEPRGLVWTPDSAAIVVATVQLRGRGPGGLWIHDIGTGSWTQLTAMGANSMAMSPDGTRIATLHATHDPRTLESPLGSKDPNASSEFYRKLSEVELLIFDLERDT